MCAINPTQKKRIIFDFYTSDKTISKKDFDISVITWSLAEEQRLNSFGKIRVHIKETNQEAD